MSGSVLKRVMDWQPVRKEKGVRNPPLAETFGPKITKYHVHSVKKINGYALLYIS